MKTVATIAIAALSLAAISTPALAGKKKAKKKAAAAAKVEAEPPHRLCDELQLGIKLATPSGEAKPAMDDDAAARGQAEAIAAASSFDIGAAGRDADAPSGDGALRIQAQTLTEAQIGDVVNGHFGEVEYCWSRVPAAQPDSLALTLHFTDEAKGNVSKVVIGGDAPAKLSSCLRGAAKRWSFPTADTTSEVDYAIVLNGK